jgi:hypothetical protein
MFHGIDEAELFLQFEKLEHVAAGAAAKTMKEPLFTIDVKRWALLRVERAEPLVGSTGLSERHVLLHDLQDVGVQA